ncbi:uncharacterized protein [Watersipora subatra]|uniref:uncharacterized protein n=1 Tax=Watersipora subatra TaxID=2589382 RepID=UPI00355C6BF7
MCTGKGLFNEIPKCVDTNECNSDPCEQYCTNTPGSYYCSCGLEYELSADGHNCSLIPGCTFNSGACDHECESVALPQWYVCSCNAPYVLYDSPGSNGYVQHPADTYDRQLRINESCVLPQCPLENLVMKFNENTEILGQYNDTTYPFYYEDSVEVLCKIGYTFPDGDQRKTFYCSMYNMSLGWFNDKNESLADLMCTKEVSCNGAVIPVQGIKYTTPYIQNCSVPFSYQIVSTCDLDIETGTYSLYPDTVCQVVDCGMPQPQQTLGSANLSIDCTTLGCSFEFTCADGSQPLPYLEPITVVCMENGKWNYSDVYCEGTTCSDPGMVVGTQRYSTEDMLPNVTFSLANLKLGGRVYYKCIKEGYELYSNGSPVNSTYCDGISFSPSVEDFECIDMQAPSIEYCPSSIEVFKYTTYRGAPFEQGEFLGYPSPVFMDNGGIQSIDISPSLFSLDHIFYEEEFSVEFTATDFEGHKSPACQINFYAIDVVTPVLSCENLIVEINETHLERTVTEEMILSVVSWDNNTDGYEEVKVEFGPTSTLISPETMKSKINQNAMVTVYRSFFVGDVAMGMNRMNHTVSAHCSVAIIPKPDLCAEEFAPAPADASRVCESLPDGGRRCNYTCDDPSSLFFQFGIDILYNTASSLCTNSSIGFEPVRDCIVSEIATAVSSHTFIIKSEDDFSLNLACYEKLVEGYQNWAITQVCNDSVADVTFSDTREGPIVPLADLFFYSAGAGSATGFTLWSINPKENLWGTEAICDTGAGAARNIENIDPKFVDLIGMDECLQPTYFLLSTFEEVSFICADSGLTPIKAGETLFEGIAYDYYSCFECPPGSYLSNTQCLPCPIGEYQSTSGTQTSCEKCTPFVSVEEGQATCVLECPAGFYGENGVYPCFPCPVNTYSLNTSYCAECPSNTRGHLNAQSSNDSCRSACEAGFYSETGFAPADGECTPCPVNFISTSPMSTSCDPCGDPQDTNGLVGQTSCTNSAFCAFGNCKNGRCNTYHGRSYCTQGCNNPDEFQGIYCEDDVDNCGRMSCDPRGTSSCENGTCICNRDIAGGELCDNITVSCDGIDCDNGGECFIITDGSGPAADLNAVCLCSGPWSGELCTEVEDKCLTAGCVNSVCVNEDVRGRCDCNLGFEGYLCDRDIDGCSSSPCYNGGNCSDVVGAAVTTDPYAFTCDCPEGFSGDQCEIRNDECLELACGDYAFCLDDYSSINSVFCISIYFQIYVNFTISISTPSFCQSLGIECQNGGVCVDDPLYKFRCDCPESGIYGGLFCQSRIDFCDPRPCGVGNCTNKEDIAGYTCQCPDGYESDGTTCVDVDECDQVENICNNGICENTVGSYNCECVIGWDGRNCDTFINQCLFTTCYGNGTCEPTDSGFMCHCTEGRTGQNCETELSLCTGQCQNNAVCSEAFGDFFCRCPQPAYGRFCEFLPDPCETQQPCPFGGVCTPDGQDFTCECAAGHAGTECEIWIDECSDNPCGENGVCKLNQGTGFTCTCDAGYEGDLCDEELDPCDPDPCPEKATCVKQGFTDYTCTCDPGFLGDFCDTPIDPNFDCYLKIGDIIQVLKPTSSQFWTMSKFTISAWIRPDRTLDQYGNFIDIIQVTIESEIILSITAHGVIFNGVAYNYSSIPNYSLDVGSWAFVGVSVEGSTITLYNNVLVVEHDLVGGIPSEKLGRINVIISPYKQFVGFCSQVYLWAGASFSKSSGPSLSGLLNFGVGQLFNLEDFAGANIHYYWNIGLYLLSPFCEVGRPSSYCVSNCEGQNNQGTFLEFERDCPSDVIVTTSSRSVAVSWDPPIFLANGKVIEPETPNIIPGDMVAIGKHEVKYSVSVGRKKLSCKFSIYVRYGCDGVQLAGRCIRPYEQSGLTYARALSRCRNFGGVLIEVESQSQISKVISAIMEAGIFNQQLMVESFIGSDDRPACVSVDMDGQYVLSGCSLAVAAVCDREVSGEEACTLPRFNDDSVAADLISSASSPFIKYQLSCVNDATEVLPSYIPKFITCYPEGNWDTILGSIPDCVVPAPPTFRFRFRIVIRFRVRIRSRCSVGSFSVFKSILNAVLGRLRSLSSRWGSSLLANDRTPKKCCADSNFCTGTSSQCESEPLALSCGCQQAARRKRQTADDSSEVDLGLNLDQLPEMLSAGGVDLSPEEVISQAVASREFMEAINDAGVEVVEEDNPNPLEGYESASLLDCADGYEPIDDTECVPCSPGTYFVNGTCAFCPLDTYQPNSTQSSCISCDPATPITYFEGSASSDDCKRVAGPGEFYNSLSRVVETCGIGYYQPGENALECIACDVGLTTISTGSNSSDQCIDICESGKEYENFVCVNCKIGFYRDAAADPVCQACPDGFYSEFEGSVSLDNCSIVDCGVGTYRDVASNTCMNCTRGSYQNQTRQEMCISCGDNFTTADIMTVAQSDCIFVCPDGYERVSGEEQCTLCALGTYRMKDIDDPEAKCKKCSTEYFTTALIGSIADDNCTVLECPAGMQSSIDNSTCEVCPKNTYSEGITLAGVMCEACEMDYITLQNKTMYADNCTLDCPDAGEETNNDVCTPCKQGFYAVAGQQTCIPCDQPLINNVSRWDTVGEGSDEQSDCSVAICSAGFFRKNDTIPEVCEPCPIGYYQEMDMTTVGMCLQCPKTSSNDSQTTTAIASQSIMDCRVTCPMGEEDVADACTECSIGSYKESAGPTPCISCPEGLTTADTGSINKTDNCSIAVCGPGNFSDGRVCTPCMMGFYQEESDFTGNSCMQCTPIGPFNRTTSAAGATDEDDCEGYVSFGFTLPFCVLVICPPGYIPHDTEGCQACPEDTYQQGDECEPCDGFITNGTTGGVNEDACTHKICVPGTENDPADSKQCRACALNTYSVNGEQCESCMNGRITKEQGAKGPAFCILDCPDGNTYAISDTCVPCAIGTYRKRGDSFDCLNCPSNATTAAIGSSSCLIPLCSAGEYAKELFGSYTCTLCPLNTYQPAKGSLSCVDCGPGKYTEVMGATNETSCLLVPTCVSTPCPDSKHTCTDTANGPQCSCPSAYDEVGSACSHICSRNSQASFCANEGKCNPDAEDISLVCTCLSDYTGVNCTSFADGRDQQNQTTLIVVGVVTGLVALAVIFGTIVAFKKGSVIGVIRSAKQAYVQFTPQPQTQVHFNQGYHPEPALQTTQLRQLGGIEEISHHQGRQFPDSSRFSQAPSRNGLSVRIE